MEQNKHLVGFKPLTDFSTPHQLTVADRLFRPAMTGAQPMVYTILLVRKGSIVCAAAGDKAGLYRKFELPVSTVGEEKINGLYTVFVPEGAAPSPAAHVAVKRERATAGVETKISKCRAIFQFHKDLDKKGMIDLFVYEVGCTPAGANTYYLTLKKEKVPA